MDIGLYNLMLRRVMTSKEKSKCQILKEVLADMATVCLHPCCMEKIVIDFMGVWPEDHVCQKCYVGYFCKEHLFNEYITGLKVCYNCCDPPEDEPSRRH